MESDIFALGVYKYQYETSEEQEVFNSPRCEKIVVYNTGLIDQPTSWLDIKFYQEAIKRKYRERFAKVHQERELQKLQEAESNIVFEDKRARKEKEYLYHVKLVGLLYSNNLFIPPLKHDASVTINSGSESHKSQLAKTPSNEPEQTRPVGSEEQPLSWQGP